MSKEAFQSAYTTFGVDIPPPIVIVMAATEFKIVIFPFKVESNYLVNGLLLEDFSLFNKEDIPDAENLKLIVSLMSTENSHVRSTPLIPRRTFQGITRFLRVAWKLQQTSFQWKNYERVCVRKGEAVKEIEKECLNLRNKTSFQWKNSRRAQETADHVLRIHSHIVVPHDDVYQSQYTFLLRLAPQMSQSPRNNWSCLTYSFPHCSASWWRLPVSIHILAQARPTNVSQSLVYNMLGDTDEMCMRACACEYCFVPPCTVYCPVLLYFCLSAIRWKSHSSKSYQKNEYCWW